MRSFDDVWFGTGRLGHFRWCQRYNPKALLLEREDVPAGHPRQRQPALVVGRQLDSRIQLIWCHRHAGP
jgi:hypothetical protein